MRRPPGYVGALTKAREVGEYFARLAELEEASVDAYRLLASELTEIDAPATFIRTARRSAKDKERQAGLVTSLARRFGGVPVLPEVIETTGRSVEEIAVHNAIEGCIRETYASLVAAMQAERADDKVVRAAMITIARDEAEHSTFAWNVGAWLETQLAPAARDRYGAAARVAVKELRGEAYTSYPEALRKVAGLPTVRDALALIDHLDKSMWAKLARTA
jgi:bacterioferritin (cytochrome b1)